MSFSKTYFTPLRIVGVAWCSRWRKGRKWRGITSTTFICPQKSEREKKRQTVQGKRGEANVKIAKGSGGSEKDGADWKWTLRDNKIICAAAWTKPECADLIIYSSFAAVSPSKENEYFFPFSSLSSWPTRMFGHGVSRRDPSGLEGGRDTKCTQKARRERGLLAHVTKICYIDNDKYFYLSGAVYFKP